ncbi:sensor histidine kinase [Variovorax sp. VNK109]|jgi:two-component system sensor histidine kinase/response regulator|uniref:sensor histidine kinase n=1 Tax=Variovorax sp. VNK109 TaxID=3400919 RepID=UPI003C074DEC
MLEIETARPPPRVLVVDDEPAVLRSLCDVLEVRGLQVEGRTDAGEALALLRPQTWDLLLCDLSMPGIDGMELVRRALVIDPDLACVMITGHASVDNAVQAMRAGAVDYLEKPLRLSIAMPVIERALEIRHLRRVKAELEATVRTQMDELRQANADLNSFAHSVSHDLRAPLQAIDGFSRLLEARETTQSDERSLHFLSRIRSSVKQMGELIEGLLLLSRLGRTAIDRHAVDLSAMGNDIVSFLREASLDHGATFDIDPELPAVQADATLLRQVLVNLMSNACKFSSKVTQPRVQLGWDSATSPHTFFVRDNGTGFDSARANEIFEPFQRLHPQSEFAGVGLGLSIVARIIARHGGTIHAESSPGQGACFRFTLSGAHE